MLRRNFLQAGALSLTATVAACGGGGTNTAAPAVPGSAGGAMGPAPGPAPSDSGGASGGASGGQAVYPFGERRALVAGRYPYGIAPTIGTAAMDDAIRASYDAWKAANLRSSPAFTATAGTLAGQRITDGMHVRFTNTAYATVSEGMGYGMLITVMMAGYDPQAQDLFNGLLRTVRGRPAHAWLTYGRPEGAYVQEWRLAADMGSAGDGWNATDGDLDIALALLMADRQWGSTGAVDYRREALATIGALKSLNFAASGEPRGPQRANTRTSDHMIGHFRSFRAATGDAFWDLAITRCLALVEGIVASHSPQAGLQPGFIVDCNTASPVPSPGWLVESAWEGDYDANSIRNPWRWGTDYVFSGDTRWGAIVDRMARFFTTDCSGDPFQLAGMYRLDGSPIGGRYFAEGVAGPLMVGCMVHTDHQTMLDTLWRAHAANFTTDYYDSELQLLPMLVAAGHWWMP